MTRSGLAFYDDDAVFAAYRRTREDWLDNPNDTLEIPIMRDLIGDVGGLRILDLGCGSAGFGRAALAAGAGSYLGVDGSRNMATQAREALSEFPNGTVVHADLETWIPPVALFDLVVSSLVLHYVEDLEAVLQRAYAALIPSGRFICSVEHPIVTASDCGSQSGPCPECLVDDYFLTGKREATWLGGTVVKYHRTIEDYIAALQRAGFMLERLRESAPDRQRFTDDAEYAKRLRTPLFLFLCGHKPA
jgi:SAM-dependent methyltransferase